MILAPPKPVVLYPYFRDCVVLEPIDGGFRWRDNSANPHRFASVRFDTEAEAMADAARVRGTMSWYSEGGTTRGQYGPSLTSAEYLNRPAPPPVPSPWNALLSEQRCHHDCRARTARPGSVYCSGHQALA